MIVAKRKPTYEAYQFLSDHEPIKEKYSRPTKDTFQGFSVFVDEKGAFIVVRCRGNETQRAYNGDYLMKDRADDWFVVTEKVFMRDYEPASV